jgi:SIR2-like domain
MSDVRNHLTEVPPSLLDDHKQGRTIFYLGSYFLDPPRIKYESEITDLFEQEKKEANVLGRAFSTVGEYEDLIKFAYGKWEVSALDRPVYQLLTKIPSLDLIITTLFDNSIERAYERYSGSKDVNVITGIESTDESYRSLNKKKPTLFKILGSVNNPKTLCLSEETMFDLRDRLMSSDNAKEFFLNIIKDKTIVLLGYESNDRFDKFFSKVVSDVCYYLESPITRNMYFVNEITYNRYYGLWENTKTENIFAIDLGISEFLRLLSKRLG